MQEKPPAFEKRYDDQYCISAADCEMLQEALKALPQNRDHMGTPRLFCITVIYRCGSICA